MGIPYEIFQSNTLQVAESYMAEPEIWAEKMSGIGVIDCTPSKPVFLPRLNVIF